MLEGLGLEAVGLGVDDIVDRVDLLVCTPATGGGRGVRIARSRSVGVLSPSIT